MSLYAYPSEQRITGDDGRPWATWYGWHISGTSFTEDLHPFTDQEDRERWIKGVESLIAPATFNEYERNVIPALCMVCAFGDETAADRIEPTLDDAFPEYSARLTMGESTIYDLAQIEGFAFPTV